MNDDEKVIAETSPACGWQRPQATASPALRPARPFVRHVSILADSFHVDISRARAVAARTKSLMNDFGLWLKEKRSRVFAKSRLGEKLGYISRHWDSLQVFLTDGRVEIDSNSVERTIHPIALNRKNALFAGHDEGGKNWGRICFADRDM